MDCELQQQNGNRGIRPAVVTTGAVVLVLGCLLLLDSTGVVDVPIGRLIGPIALITLGSVTIVEKGGFVYGYRGRRADSARRLRPRGGLSGGVWMIGIGVWMLVSQTHLFGLDYHNSWPLFIILSGIMMLIRGVR
jgi:hypothetical protein